MGKTPPKRRRRNLATPARPSTLPLRTKQPIPLPGKRGSERPPERLGEYRILRPLGEGAMGKVYEAEQESLGRHVALKVLPDDFAHDEQAVERFEREAKAAAAMHHPNIVQVYGFGKQDRSYYYTMEHVSGCSLRQLLIDGEELAAERAIAKYILQVALALDYAHGQGVIHRDIKPDNILVREKDDQAMVLDFGLSRTERARTITQVGALMGTPNYMAPEQTLGRKIDHRIDVYALGATFYECLTGELPFFHAELRRLLSMIKHEQPTPIRELRPDVDQDLVAICNKAMEKRPEDRYPTAKALADDLIRYMRGEVALARQAKPWQFALRKARNHPAVVALAGALAVVVLISAVWIRTVSGGDVQRAEELLTQAQALVLSPLQRYRDEAKRLQSARQAAGRAEQGGLQLNRALLAFREAESDLLESAGGDAASADQALNLLDEVRAVIRETHPLAAESRELAHELVVAQWRRAERQANTELAAAHQRELLDLGVLEGAQERKSTLSVTSDPAGARVVLYKVENDLAGNWLLGEATDLGSTPLDPGLVVEPGEYLVKLEAARRASVRVPIEVGGLADARIRVHVSLPRAERVPEGFSYLPAGEIYVGGDPHATRPLYQTREPEWVAGFFLARHEVTVQEYAEFLKSLSPGARAQHMKYCEQLSRQTGQVSPLAGFGAQAISGIRLASARAYCQWRARREGVPYRLPTDVEWEKAARGPAGRVFPWGDRFDPRAERPIAHLHLGPANGRPLTAAVGTSLKDVSIYGIHDMGGNLSEWVEGSFGGDPRFGVLRGGSWSRGPEVVRSASREPVDSADDAGFRRVHSRTGLRLAFTPER